ncbi:MAG: tetratricopeptide repeat protein [Chloroflexi bacterium]|nr:tetratricopeptide repeat protein [Chloroflexota bacterium]
MATATRPKSSFGPWLKQRRRELDLTQAELAGRIGCATDTVKKMESGALRPSKQLSELMAVFFGVPSIERATFVQFARGLGGEVALTLQPATASAAQPPPATEALFHAPAPVTSLVGRQREVQAATRLLLQPGTRLLTLYGPPGVGKTRLSLEIASALQGEFKAGVCFVPLAPIGAAALVLPAIAASLRVREERGAALLETVQAYLSDKRLLLVLDNFEQVVEAGPVLHDLLTAAPGVKALVSSREALKLYGEQGFPVPPLEAPDMRGKSAPPLEALALYAAVELFVQRARAIKPDFVLSRSNAAQVAQICAWLDGLPLAIEMAAAQVKWLPLPRLLSELSERLTELTGGMRDLSPRQQTLRGAIDWSYQLLSPADRGLFAALAVFTGGFTADAAQAVISNLASPISNLQSPSSILESLADKSLLHHDTDAEGEVRFAMFEIIREYALEKLEQSGAAIETARRHAGYYLALARQFEPQISGPHEDLWLGRMDADISNLRAALDWYAANDVPSALQMAVSMWQYWYMRGHFSEGCARLEDLIVRSDGTAPPVLRAWALRAAAALHNHLGNWQHATEQGQQCLQLFRESGARDGVAAALHLLGNIVFMRSDYTSATELYTEALAYYREAGNLQSAGTILRNMGLIAKDQADFSRAIALYEQSIALHRQIGNTRGVAATLMHISIAHYWQGEFSKAAEVGEQALALLRQTDDRLDEAYALENLAMVMYKLGNLARAGALLDDSLNMMRDLGNKSGMALVYTDSGQLACKQGDLERAADLHRQGLQFSIIVDDKRRMAFCLEGLAMAAVTGQPARAAQLFGAAAHLRQVIGSPLPPSETADIDAGVAQARGGIGGTAYAAAYATGAAMSLDQAVAFAQESG